MPWFLNENKQSNLRVTRNIKNYKTNKYKYTFQASYFNIDDKKAKEIHLKAFDLK